MNYIIQNSVFTFGISFNKDKIESFFNIGAEEWYGGAGRNWRVNTIKKKGLWSPIADLNKCEQEKENNQIMKGCFFLSDKLKIQATSLIQIQPPKPYYLKKTALSYHHWGKVIMK